MPDWIHWIVNNRGDLINVAGLALSIYAIVSAVQTRQALAQYREKARRLKIVEAFDRVCSILSILGKCRDPKLPQSECDRVREYLSQVIGSIALDEDQRATVKLFVAQIREAPVRTEQSLAYVRKMHETMLDICTNLKHGLEELL
jgi:hypothetical protein